VQSSVFHLVTILVRYIKYEKRYYTFGDVEMGEATSKRKTTHYKLDSNFFQLV